MTHIRIAPDDRGAFRLRGGYIRWYLNIIHMPVHRVRDYWRWF